VASTEALQRAAPAAWRSGPRAVQAQVTPHRVIRLAILNILLCPLQGTLSARWRTLATGRFMCMDLHTLLSPSHTVSDHPNASILDQRPWKWVPSYDLSVRPWSAQSFGTLFALYPRAEKGGWGQGMPQHWGEGMLLQYCSLHARLFSWKDHTWKDFSRAKINQIRGYGRLLRSAKPDSTDLQVIESPCDRCAEAIEQILRT